MHTLPAPLPAMSAADVSEMLRHQPTRYEIVLTLADGRRMLVGYTPRKSRDGMLGAVQRVGRAILSHMPDLTDEHRMTWKRGGFDMGNGARVAWSGRTQRDALQHGPLPYVAAEAGGAA